MKKIIYLFCVFWWLLSLWWWVWAASLQLFPATWTFVKNCPFDVNIILDTEWVAVQTSEIQLINTDDFLLGFSSKDSLFPMYSDLKQSKIRNWSFFGKSAWYILWTTLWWWYVLWSGKFGTITIVPLSWQDTLALDFYMIPGVIADDSNVLSSQDNQSIKDVLTIASWWTYTFIDGTCPVDVQQFILSYKKVTSSEILSQDTFLQPQLKDVVTINENNAMKKFDFSKMKYAYLFNVAIEEIKRFVFWYVYILHWWYLLFF